ncbi:MAG: hypothetical protein JNG84_13190 [Archangium sp.]|nr:hypothetical protein [Archangium sp.]
MIFGTYVKFMDKDGKELNPKARNDLNDPAISGPKGYMQVFSFKYGVKVVQATGASTGNRQWDEFEVKFDDDGTAALLTDALVKNSRLKVEILWVASAQDGGTQGVKVNRKMVIDGVKMTRAISNAEAGTDGKLNVDIVAFVGNQVKVDVTNDLTGTQLSFEDTLANVAKTA